MVLLDLETVFGHKGKILVQSDPIAVPFFDDDCQSSLMTGSGSIDPNELRTVLKWCLKESSISLPEEKLDDLTVALFESADSDKSGSITFEELREELERFPEVMENLTIRYFLYINCGEPGLWGQIWPVA